MAARRRTAEAGFLDALKGREEISITTRGRRTGRAITLLVWFAVDDGTLWLLPVRGSRTQWYRNVRADPAITVQAGRARHTGTAQATTNSREVDAAIRMFQQRYTPQDIARYYTVLDVAVKVHLRRT